MLLVAGLTFVAIPATAAVTPALSVTDADDVTPGIQVYGIRAEDVSFQLTVTFQDTANSNANTQVTGFDVNDIVLYPADSSNNIIPGGATAVPVSPNANSSVYTTTITVKGNISKVIVQVPAAAAQTLPTIGQNDQVTPGRDTAAGTPANLVVNIVRSAAPPLTISADTSISGQAPFTVTLTSTKAITLTHADIHVTGGDIPTNGLSSDTTRKVWTVTIRPVIDVEEVIVRPATNGAFIFPKGTFTVGPQITRQGSARALAGKVAISEIMFATNGNTNEVQWIEIFNSSQNEAVALDADRGWRLIIENYDDPGSKVARLGSINFKDDGDVKTIPPRQTVLIVSTASSTRNSDRTHFVSTRVFDVYAELASEFGMSRRADPFLHPTQGFHIELVDGRSETVDAIGNLDGRTGLPINLHGNCLTVGLKTDTGPQLSAATVITTPITDATRTKAQYMTAPSGRDGSLQKKPILPMSERKGLKLGMGSVPTTARPVSTPAGHFLSNSRTSDPNARRLGQSSSSGPPNPRWTTPDSISYAPKQGKMCSRLLTHS